MSKFYNTDDIIKLFQKQDDKIEDLECLFDKCCSKIPINIGNGIGLFNKLYRNKWEFKSLIAGSNITITDNGNDLTINSTGGGTVTCEDIDTCLGISALGASDKYLNEQGSWQTITIPTNFITSVSDTSTVDLIVSAGNLTADVKLNTDYIGFGDSSSKLTGDTNFKFNSTTGLVLNKPTFGLSATASSALLRDDTFAFEIAGDGFSMYEYGGTGRYFFIDADSKLYSFGDLTGGTAKLDIDGSGSFISLDSPLTYITNLATPGTLMVVADGTGLLSKQAIPTGSVTSVDMSVPTGLSISGNPITTSGTLALSLTAGYVIPTTTEETNWNTAYTNRIISLTTTGTSGAATLIANILNIPQYTDTYVGTVTSVGLSMPSAFTVTNSPVTSSGTLTVTGAGTTAEYIRGDGSLATFPSSTTRLDQILAATATNSINNASFEQDWFWNTLAGTNGLHLQSTSTAATASSQVLFRTSLSGANVNAGQTTYSFVCANSHTGATSSNIAGYFSATGGTNNYAIVVPLNEGRVGIGLTTPITILDVFQSQNSAATVRITNNTSGTAAQADFRAYNSSGDFFSVGIYSAATSTYGALTARSALNYASSTAGIVLMADNATGIIKFATGGNTERWRIDAAGGLTNTSATATSTFNVNGSFAAAYIAKTANYTLTISDYTVDCTTNTFTITLPTAVGITGRIYNIKNTGTGIITINTTSSQTIDGNASGVLTLNQWENLTVQSTNTNWIIL